jgi:hypothetical protein
MLGIIRNNMDKYNLMYFTSDYNQNILDQSILTFFRPFVNRYMVLPGLLVPESHDQLLGIIQSVHEEQEDPLLFVGVGMEGYWANCFANRFLSPRVLFNPILNPVKFFQHIGAEREATKNQKFTDDLYVSHGVPGLILKDEYAWDIPFELTLLFQVETVSNRGLFDFSKNSKVTRIISDFMNDLDRIAI